MNFDLASFLMGQVTAVGMIVILLCFALTIVDAKRARSRKMFEMRIAPLLPIPTSARQ